ncbi:hypothetical protein BD309DRAFT_932923 [Dichomitus squalens]|uniref:Uncharacterized protein n=1 Tax=Dichomitus squalens TaxID=114155 RepID=A0A4Q9NC26_9APHY|nr:hypothetical protein BD309DRAFT_932923 [Dichomitus squalens]TBU52389.1 hypothetical protein BD310DRAFT_832332 [Dichomitus squalens]
MGGAGDMYAGSPFGIAACVLSFIVNFFATIIVAYKAWTSRRFFRKLMVWGDTTARMERLFSILVESGMVYCTIWILVVVYQFSYVQTYGSVPAISAVFQDAFSLFVDGGLVPIIAIYPAVVIILIAQNRSHMVEVLSGGAVKTPQLSHLDGIQSPNATVLHIAQQEYQVRDGSEEYSTLAADEWEIESGGIA